jgi:hypothetical protein
MTKSTMVVAALAPFVFVTMIVSAAAFSAAWSDSTIEKRVERACHREVRKKTPQGHRDLSTLKYELDGAKTGIASGSLRSELRPGRWAPISWTCHVRTDSARVLRVEFSFPTTGSKLGAIASHV